jgi:hypothetical protein
LTVLPDAVDCQGQFSTPIYAAFGAGDQTEDFHGLFEHIIRYFLNRIEVLSNYLRNASERWHREDPIVVPSLDGRDNGINLAVTNMDVANLQTHEVQVVTRNQQVRKLEQRTAEYDQLVYPLIFWNGNGGCG